MVKLEWQTAVGKQIKVGEKTGTVIGVVEDFIFTDIGFSIPPAALYIDTKNLNFLFFKYSSSADFAALSSDLKEIWQALFPDLPFTCLTLDGYFNTFTGVVEKFSSFMNIFGLTAVLFSCLGLLGLAAHAIERRTKEIGLRKILGASTSNITWMVIREFLLLVLIGNFIALGLLYYGWHKVMQTGLLFIQNISFSTYASALLASLSIAFIAVISQTIKTTRRNPVETLRFE
ncbi:MAG TPA: FtsX-like permease family protein [Desulfobacteraceae bacterium]|nr:FtsX-like permease family protein [Desulfobacteraceae bacterium]